MDKMLISLSLQVPVDLLSDAEAGRLFKSALKYAQNAAGEQPTGREGVLWPLMKEQIDKQKKDDELYRARQRSNGLKGGHRKNPQEPTGTHGLPRVAMGFPPSSPVSPPASSSPTPLIITPVPVPPPSSLSFPDDDGDNARTREDFQDGAEKQLAPFNPVRYMRESGIPLNAAVYQELREYLDGAIGDDLLKWAVDQSVSYGAPKWSYIKRTLDRLLSENVKTVAQAKQREDERRRERERTGQSGRSVDCQSHGGGSRPGIAERLGLKADVV